MNLIKIISLKVKDTHTHTHTHTHLNSVVCYLNPYSQSHHHITVVLQGYNAKE